ncbi:uncharacterized protein LOC115329946, partial [Ixodes scapularis]|uniref:uncharacterized protein LOC115329946 n=1 Tax=Ixodes scapularis TaxID=6945 RepID=UPI001AD6339B
RWSFPSFDHVMWRNNLEDLPRVSEGALEALCASETPSSRQRSKSYAFATEAYTLPSSVMTNVCDSRLGVVYAKATCFRSQKKTGVPYKIQVAFRLDTGAVTGATCECPAGASGACSHILATLRLIILLKTKGYKETPPELSCTELPQQWRRPRRQGIRPMSVQDVDWRSPREGGMPTPMPVRLFDACAKKQDEQRQLELLHELGRTLQSLGNQDFGAVLLAARGPLTDTKLGPAPAGSPLSYQQAMLPSGYKTWTSANISAGIGLATSVPELSLFDGTRQHTFSGTFSAEEWQILTGIEVSPESARELELNSRQQGRSAHWRDARRHRLTASSFGRGSKREQWTETGLRNLIEPKDISHVRAVQYGLRNESLAADRYTAVMTNFKHNVSLQHCGLVVNPGFPWLGATPDRLVYDPEELSYGVLEIKCPYSLKDTEPDYARMQNFYITFNENDEPHLDRDHDHYAQVLGQMALTGCRWGDFVVCSEKWIVVERIRFNFQDWVEMRQKLDDFYFRHMLPYVARK